MKKKKKSTKIDKNDNLSPKKFRQLGTTMSYSFKAIEIRRTNTSQNKIILNNPSSENFRQDYYIYNH